MTGIRFRRRVGAAADISELEYVVALHQTSDVLRENATISSRDVMRMLQSRYWLRISHEQAIELVRSFTGDLNNGRSAPSTQEMGGNRSTRKDRRMFEGNQNSHEGRTSSDTAVPGGENEQNGEEVVEVPPYVPPMPPSTTTERDNSGGGIGGEKLPSAYFEYVNY